MANLETLELRISANAQEATRGLGKLIGSLLQLQKVVPGATRELQKFNDQLGVLKGFKNLTLGGLAKSVGSAKKIMETTEAVKQQTNAVHNLNEQLQPQTSATTTVTGHTAEVVEQTQELNNETEAVKDNVNGIAIAVKNLGGSETYVDKLTSSFGRMLTSVSRIAKTMLIRTAIRAVIKGAKEGLDNFYEYSKRVGNGYAAQIDRIASKWKQIKNQMGATLGQALAAVIPILKVIADVALVAFNALSALFALLSGKDTYSQAVLNNEEYAESANNASKANKELLASFDELNVIQHSTGSGGASANINYQDMFQEVALPQWMIEWKPLIEAILAGVLGATILPAIWDWIKRIFGLFTGSGATNALNLLTSLLGNGTGAVPALPDFTPAATQMSIFAAACTTAAAALPTISACITEILAAFQGMNLLQTVIGLIASIIAALVSGVGGKIEISVDDKKWKEWKEEFEEYDWSRTLTIKTNLFNEAFIKGLMEWLDNDVTKTVKVNMSIGNIEGLLTIVSWTNEDATKNITLKIYDDGEVIGHLMEWVAQEDTKKIKIEIEMPFDIPVGEGDDNGGDGSFWQNIMNRINELIQEGPDETVDTKTLWDQIFNQPIWVSIGEWIGFDDPRPIWEVIDEAVGNLFNTDNPYPVVVGLDDLIELSEDEDFVYEVNNMFFENVGKVLSDKNIRELKAKFPGVKATDIFQVSGWDNMGEEARQGFVDSMREHFGDKETIEALKKIGANVDDYIQTGLDSKTPAAKVTSGFAQGQDPATKITKPLNDATNKPFTATLKSDWAKGFDPKTVTATAASQATADVQLNSKIDAKKLKSTVTKAVKNVKGTVSLVSQFDKESTPAKVAQKFKELKPTITLNATITKTFAMDVGKQVGTGVDTVLKGKKYSVSVSGGIATLHMVKEAEGGIVPRSADIFMANENGKSEMIGRIGNQTAVANQEQMVEAMARGVEYANAEQNSLLREQNNLLMRILQKEGTVNLGASSALGRTVRQSLNMYESLVGG